MPSFTSQYVGGPACGKQVTTNRAPVAGETLIYESERGYRHIYAWKCFQWFPPAWRYVGVIFNKPAVEQLP